MFLTRYTGLKTCFIVFALSVILPARAITAPDFSSLFTNDALTEIAQKYCTDPKNVSISCNSTTNLLYCDFKKDINTDDVKKDIGEYCSNKTNNKQGASTSAGSKQATQTTTPTEISSTIVDQKGEPLIGVTILVEGVPNHGTTTDLDGKFTIKIPTGATGIKISYIGMETMNFSPTNVPEKITMTETSTELSGVTVTACSANLKTQLHATELIWSPTKEKCIPTKCIDHYKLSNEEYLTDDDGEFELDDEDQKILIYAECIDTNGLDCDPMPDNAKTATLENGQCIIKECNNPKRYKLVDNKCIDQVGQDCTSKIPHAINASYQMEGGNLVCKITKCEEPGWIHNDTYTKCEESDGPCTAEQIALVSNAISGSLRKGKCIITECAHGYRPSDDGTQCEKAQLSEEDSKNKVAELRDNANNMKAKEQSFENRMLGATSTFATGMGGKNLMSGLAEQKADQAAEEDMKAYLATFVCDYGQGRNIKGGEHNIDLPGGNDMFAIVNEYRALAADLKARKEALGKQPGIESEIIYDISETGLYDDVALGRQSGSYASISRALMDETGEDAKAWAQQKADTASKVKTGAIVAGAGVVAGVVGNLAINSGDKNKNKADKIIADYDKKTSGEQVTSSNGASNITPEVDKNKTQVNQTNTSNITPEVVENKTPSVTNNNATQNSETSLTPLTEEQMRKEMANFVTACESYKDNGTIGMFVVDNNVKPWFVNMPDNYHQKAFCLFLRKSDDANASGKKDPQLAKVKQASSVPDLETLMPDGYVLVPDPNSTSSTSLRCKKTFGRVKETEKVRYHGNGHYFKEDYDHGPALSCDFSYKHL